MKIILGIFIASLFSSAAFAQEIQFGDPATQKLSIKISESGDVHVTHEIQSSENTQQVELLSPDFENLTIINDEGEKPEYGDVGGEKPVIVLFPTRDDITLEYDVKGIVQNKSGLWTWDFVYLADVSFFLPDSIRLFYVNDNLVDLKDQEGIRCHGCQVMLQYELEPTIVTETIQWEDKKFDVKVITQQDISLKLDQPNKKLSFEVDEANQFVTLIIPQDLLWNPYEVLLNDKPVEKQERMGEDNMIWLHLKPNETGTIEIIGVSVVPEFPFAMILVLSVSMMIAVYANRLSHR